MKKHKEKLEGLLNTLDPKAKQSFISAIALMISLKTIVTTYPNREQFWKQNGITTVNSVGRVHFNFERESDIFYALGLLEEKKEIKYLKKLFKSLKKEIKTEKYLTIKENELTTYFYMYVLIQIQVKVDKND